MPVHSDDYFIPVTNSTNVTFNINDGTDHHESYSPYRTVEISESLRYFFDNISDTHGSQACYYFKHFMLGDMNSHSGEMIGRMVFPKIQSMSEDNNGYVILNGNQKIKFGKLIVKVAEVMNIKFDDKTESNLIEKFVDQYKSWYKAIYCLEFKILKGDQILKGYDTDCQARHSGMLWTSCMNNRPDFLRLYTDNPDKIQLLTLVDKKDKIYGRSLIWKLDNREFMFMDRIYGIDNYINDMFINYAMEHKISYREQPQVLGFKIYLPNGETTDSNKCPLKVSLNCKHLKYFPYMDSLYIWNKWGDTFSTSLKSEPNMKYHVLKSTFGTVKSYGLKIFGIKLTKD